MIYSTRCTWFMMDWSEYAPPTEPEETRHESIDEAIDYLVQAGWEKMTDTQIVMFDKFGFMDVITYVEMEN